MKKPLLGIANSVSASFNFDFQNTFEYALQSRFEVVQIYLNPSSITSQEVGIIEQYADRFQKIYFHAEGFFNPGFFKTDYFQQLLPVLENFPDSPVIIHFDENALLEDLIPLVEQFSDQLPGIYLENYFQLAGKEAAEKNLKKYMALFTLSNSSRPRLFPVLDIPRFFHRKLGFAENEALEWCFQFFNYFGNRHLPMVLHLIDATSPEQQRNQYCALGEGYIPYDRIFQFILKTSSPIEAIILEFEDKINPLKSREYLQGIGVI